jgi:hypothetical protein
VKTNDPAPAAVAWRLTRCEGPPVVRTTFTTLCACARMVSPMHLCFATMPLVKVLESNPWMKSGGRHTFGMNASPS